jgi:hypothetical protein
MSSRSMVFRGGLSALMGAVIVMGVFSAGADAKKSHKHKSSKPTTTKQHEPDATKKLLAQCDTLLSVSAVSSLTGLTLQAGTTPVSAQPSNGGCSGDYVITETVGGGANQVTGNVTEISIGFNGVKLTGGPLNATKIAMASYETALRTNQSLDAACATSPIYPAPTTGIGTAAFTDGAYGQCSTTAVVNAEAVDGPMIGTVSVINSTLYDGPYTTTGTASLLPVATAVLNHDFEAIGLAS